MKTKPTKDLIKRVIQDNPKIEELTGDYPLCGKSLIWIEQTGRYRCLADNKSFSKESINGTSEI